MIDIDKWTEILQAITRNKARSFLTAFGIFWGIFMLVLLMGGAKGMRAMLESTFDGFAQNSYMAFAGKTTQPYAGFQVGRTWSFEQRDLETLRQQLPEADVVTGMVAFWGAQYKYRDKKHNGVMKGVYPVYQQVENPKVVEGRYIQETDIRDFRKVCVIGKQVKTSLFPDGSSPIGKFINVSGIYFQVVGVSNTSSNMSVGGDSKSSIYVPFTTLQRIMNRGTKFDILAVTAKPGVSVSDLQPKIENRIFELHNIAPDDKRAINSFNFEAMFQMVTSLFEGINILVWLIGIGTLLSGSIGVSNIMMVVVKERTTEIGIRRAIGASPSNILSQILTESMVLTVLAGLSGIVLAVLILAGAETVIASMPDMPQASFQISFGMAIGAAVVLSLLGTAAGIAPALRALAIKPIDAIRDE